MKNFKKIGALLFLSAYLIIGFSFASPTLAADPVRFTPQITIPGSTDFQQGASTSVGKISSTTVTSDLLARYIAAFYNWGLSIVGVLAVLMLMAGGITWLTSGGDSGKIGNAKKMIEGSILGTFLLLGAYFFLNTINPDLTKLPAIEMASIKVISVPLSLNCCDSIKGETKIPIKVVNGKNIATDGSLAGKEVTCGNNAPICSGKEICLLSTENKYTCYADDWCCSCNVGSFIVDHTTSCRDSITKDECSTWCGSLSSWRATVFTKKMAATNKCYDETDSDGNMCFTKPGATCGSNAGSTCRAKGSALKDAIRCPDNSTHDFSGDVSCAPGYFCCY